MFPIHFNSPYRKKDGSLTTMEKALDGAGADLDLIDLDDVAITDPAEGDGLIYDNTAHKWKNIPIISRILTLFNAWKKNGAYNLAYYNFTTQVVDGVTVTVNADKSITLNNTATAPISIHLFQTASASAVGLKEGETYKLVGLTPTTPECYLKVNIIYNSQNHVAEDSGNGATFTFTGTSYGDFYYDFYLVIPNGTAFNNDTIYPMITTDPNATYADYVEYAMTNSELTEKMPGNTLGTAVDISSYTSSGNQYTCPSDGYVMLAIPSGSSFVEVELYNTAMELRIPQSSMTTLKEAWMVKKGCKVFLNNSNNITVSFFRFYPLQ